MRYLIQIFVMLGDVGIALACAIGIHIAPTQPLTWVLVALVFWVWHEQGGFMAWQPKNIRMFLANAKKLGL